MYHTGKRDMLVRDDFCMVGGDNTYHLPKYFGIPIPNYLYLNSNICHFVTRRVYLQTNIIMLIHNPDCLTDLDLYGHLVCNPSDMSVDIPALGRRFHIPSHSSFLLSDFSKIGLLVDSAGMLTIPLNASVFPKAFL